jgi:hypothetical protein
MRGTPRKPFGAISRRLTTTVSTDSAKETTQPVTSCITVEKLRSATWQSGR